MPDQEYENKPNRGRLFRSKNKESERHPDYWGKITIGDDVAKWAIEHPGEELDLAGWQGETANGNPKLALSISTPWVPGGDEVKVAKGDELSEKPYF